MKFVSKNSNYRVMLTPGVPGNPISGTPGKPGISVKFEGGEVVINDEETAKLMKQHPSFGQDFILVDESEADPYKDTRNDPEPEHRIADIKHGNIANVEKAKKELSPAMKKAILEAAKPLAVEIAKDLAPKLAVDLLKKLKEDSESDVEEKKPASKLKKPQKTDKKK